MSNESTVVLEEVKSHSKVKDFLALAKLRLTSLVVFSAVLGYFMAATTVNFLASLAYLIIGGFLVTGSSNAFNQVIEREADKKMNRTSDRPLPAGRWVFLRLQLWHQFGVF